MNYSRQQLYTQGMPFGESATRLAYGKKRIYGGGGSGSSGEREATAEEKRLWGAQASSLEQMNQIAMPNLTTGMNNLGTLANESMDGTLANRMRGMAGADASAAMGQGLTGARQQLERFGSTMNPNALGAQMNNAGLQGAAMKSNAMNMANIGAEDMKWNRNAALTGLASGQGAQAVNGMGSLAGQIGQSRQSSNAMDMQQQSNQAQTMGGLMIGGKMMGLYKDGGEVRAMDGLRMYKPVTLTAPSPFSFQADDEEPQTGGGIMPTVVNAGTATMASRMAANGLDKVGISAPKQAIDGLWAAGKEAFGAGAAPTASGLTGGAALDAGVTAGAAQANLAGLTGGAALDAGVAAGAASSAAGTAGSAAAAGGAAAGGAAAGGLMTAAMTAAPWLLGGYAIGSMLDLWADGGEVRKDMSMGGEVKGPGTTTSDSIKALLSDEEGVVNARGMKLPHAETLNVVKAWAEKGGTGGDLAMAINDRGLEKRYGKEGAKASPRYEGGAQKLALGGLAQALGQGIYQAAPMLNQMDQQKRMDERWQKQDARADAAEGRTAAMHGVMLEDRTEKKAKEAEVAEIMGAWSRRMRQMGEASKALGSGQLSNYDFAAAVAPEYSNLIADGKVLQPLADGSFALTEGAGPKAAMKKLSADDAAKYLASPEMFMKARRQMYEDLAAVDPAYAARADAMLGQELEASRDTRNFTRTTQRDAVGDSQFDARMKQSDKQHADASARGWAGINMTKAEREEAKKREAAIEAVRAGLYGETNPNATPTQVNAARLGVIPAVPERSKINDLKATNGLSQLQARYGGRLEGGMWFPDKENRDIAIKANSAYERYIKAGHDPMEAAEAAINEAEGKAPAGGAPSFKTPGDLDEAIKSGKVKKGDRVTTPAGVITVR